jgi:hypothetical protein
MNKLELAKLLASVFETPVEQAADDTDELVRKRMVQRRRTRPNTPAPRPPAAAQPPKTKRGHS